MAIEMFEAPEWLKEKIFESSTLSVDQEDDGHITVYIDDKLSITPGIYTGVSLKNLGSGDTISISIDGRIYHDALNLSRMRDDLSSLLFFAGYDREISDIVTKNLKPSELVRLYPINVDRTLEIICLLHEELNDAHIRRLHE